MSNKDGGAVFMTANEVQQTTKPKAKVVFEDAGEAHSRYQAACNESRLAGLSAKLGVSIEALKELECGWASGTELERVKAWGSGWTNRWRDKGAFSFPERDETGNVVGFCFRLENGNKGAAKAEVTGWRRGVVVPKDLPSRAGAVYIVEGASDVAALTTVGIAAVGRPSNAMGAEIIAGNPALAGRDLLVLGENDRKSDGQWPGREGARKVAGQLAEKLGHAVCWALPPGEAKDARSWLGDWKAKRHGAGNSMDAQACDVAREEFLAGILSSTTVEHPSVGPDSILAPIGSRSARIEWTPVPITELALAASPTWVWNGYVAKGHVTLFTGLWKSGKTTLLGSLLHDLTEGGGLVSNPTGMKTLIISEESSSLWSMRRDKFGLGSNVHVIARPFKSKASNQDWVEFVGHVAWLVHRNGYEFVIFDTLPSVWPVVQENDASEVGAALLPVNSITQAGAGVMLIHHPRKGDGQEGQASRGSGALPGFVDVIVEMRRYTPDDNRDCRRSLTTLSRFDESPPSSVIEFKDGHYVVIGDGSQVQQFDRFETIESLLPATQPGLTVDELVDAWPTELKPGKRTVSADLAAGFDSKRWMRDGTGKKGSPYRFFKASECDSRKGTSLGAGNESGPSGEAPEGAA